MRRPLSISCSRKMDLEILRLEIYGKELINGQETFMTYCIVVTSTTHCWSVRRRYREFLALHESLALEFESLPPFPPKFIFGNTEEEKTTERQHLLEHYLSEVLLVHGVNRCSLLLNFLKASENVGRISVVLTDQVLEAQQRVEELQSLLQARVQCINSPAGVPASPITSQLEADELSQERESLVTELSVLYAHLQTLEKRNRHLKSQLAVTKSSLAHSTELLRLAGLEPPPDHILLLSPKPTRATPPPVTPPSPPPSSSYPSHLPQSPTAPPPSTPPSSSPLTRARERATPPTQAATRRHDAAADDGRRATPHTATTPPARTATSPPPSTNNSSHHQHGGGDDGGKCEDDSLRKPAVRASSQPVPITNSQSSSRGGGGGRGDKRRSPPRSPSRSHPSPPPSPSSASRASQLEQWPSPPPLPPPFTTSHSPPPPPPLSSSLPSSTRASASALSRSLGAVTVIGTGCESDIDSDSDDGGIQGPLLPPSFAHLHPSRSTQTTFLGSSEAETRECQGCRCRQEEQQALRVQLHLAHSQLREMATTKDELVLELHAATLEIVQQARAWAQEALDSLPKPKHRAVLATLVKNLELQLKYERFRTGTHAPS